MCISNKNILKKLSLITIPRLWIALFVTAFLIALLVQLVVLPHIVPQWNAGHGLLIGGDCVGFHQIAVVSATKI